MNSSLPPRSSRRTAHARHVRTPLVSMGPSLEDERRRHRTARIVAVSSVLVVAVLALIIWLAGALSREVVTAGTQAERRAATPTAAATVTTGAPNPQLLAQVVLDPDPAPGETSPTLRLQVPILASAVTGIGFLQRHERGVLPLDPPGVPANTTIFSRLSDRFLSTRATSDLRWYELREGTPSMVIIGALAGTEVYAPIDGTIQAISPYRVGGETQGSVMQLQPVGDGQTIVVVRNLDADPALHVGMTVSQSTTRIGTVRDLSGSLDMPLARYTHDSGSGVDMYALRDTASQPFTL